MREKLKNKFSKPERFLQIRYFMMTELLCAVAILAVVTTSFFMIVNGMSRAENNFTATNRAILVLDNTLERIAPLKRRTADKIKSIFYDEYSKSSINGNRKVSPKCEIRKNSVQLSVEDKKKRTIVKITVKI
jgi:hypothetical protein